MVAPILLHYRDPQFPSLSTPWDPPLTSETHPSLGLFTILYMATAIQCMDVYGVRLSFYGTIQSSFPGLMVWYGWFDGHWWLYGLSRTGFMVYIHSRYQGQLRRSWIGVRASWRCCFTKIKVQIESDFRLAQHREIVSCPPEKMCSMATAETERIFRFMTINS